MVLEGIARKPISSIRYPHMLSEDIVIWRRFVECGFYVPDKVWYDVRVGGGVYMDSGQPEWLRKMAEYTYRKRIDVVARRGRDYWIIEAKPLAGVVALGQAIYYANAFKIEYKPLGSVIPAVVTDIMDQDVGPIFDKYGVVVFEVGRGEVS